MPDRPPLVLVHSPLLGPASLAATAESLRAHGYPVLVPSLVDSLAEGPSYYRTAARRVADSVAAAAVHGPLVLIGHSGAGALLPTIAETVPAPVRTAVFVDALLPQPGHSWFDTAPAELRRQLVELASNGYLPPWHEWFPDETVAQLVPAPDLRAALVAEIPRVPLAYFEELVPTVETWPPHRVCYLRLSEAYDRQAAEADERGWPVIREQLDHLAVLTRPDAVAERIAALLEP